MQKAKASKECIECNKFISYKNWAIHLRTEIHADNVARYKILFNRQLEQLEKERKQEEHMHAVEEKVVEKFQDINIRSSIKIDPASDFNPIFKNKKSKLAVFNHHPSLPNDFRMLILRESNCGKTNLFLKLILTPGCIDFNNLIMISSTAEQKEYQLLYHGFNNNLNKEDIIKVFKLSEELNDFSIEEICYELRREHTDGSFACHLSSSENKILHPCDIPTVFIDNCTAVKTLMVFDDLVCVSNQSLMAEYFVLGRHYNINTIYLAQSLIKVPKNCIRDNSNIFILFH